MKRYFMLFLLLGLSCEKDAHENSVPLNAVKIVGSWQIISESYSIGGPQIRVEVENGGIYNFVLDGTFTFKYEIDSAFNFSGTYKYEQEILTISYLREEEHEVRKLKALFDDNKVVLIPWDPICIEGCSTTLQKLN